METLHVLVVDDERGMRLSIQKALGKFVMTLPNVESPFRFEVDIAASGDEAIEKITSMRPDILLLDYKLPGINGLDVLDRVRMTNDAMMTIMITAYASIDIAITAIKQGAFDFIAKPFTPKELEKTVAKAAQNLILARQVRKLAEEKKQVRFQFISVLGHELKSPLNAVEGYLNQMDEKLLGADLSAYETMVQRSLIRIGGMRKLIADLLDLTRLESGQKKREIKKIDLVSVAKEAMESVQTNAQERGITLHLECDPPLEILADPDEMTMMLNNLISNAVKYNRDQGDVFIRLDRTGSTLRIEVQDSGIGMTQEETEQLFHEFVRIKNAKTRAIEGSGLGLTILKKIATMYGGTINVHSEPDVGSTFTVLLKNG